MAHKREKERPAGLLLLFFSFWISDLFAGNRSEEKEGWGGVRCLTVDELTEKGRWGLLLVIVVHARGQRRG